MPARSTSGRAHHERLPASAGHGPLLQRDYWGRIQNARLPPSQVGELLARRFADFAPASLASFRRSDGTDRPLEVGDILEVWIRFAGEFEVRVLHRDANSLTVATLSGHPEAGRITFGAYRHADGDVIFHIRSRARSSSRMLYVGFLALGQAMQASTWTRFVERVANEIGDGVVDFVFEETRECAPEPDETDRPTFIASGD
jgi:hypothetical protein